MKNIISIQKAIIIGASSGIGKELAKILIKNNYIVGMAARRIELLKELQKEIPSKTYIKQIDVSKTEEAIKSLSLLIEEMEGMDLIIICAGVDFINPELNWGLEKKTIGVNVSGFTAMADASFNYFSKKGSGHIAGISSIAAIRGAGEAPAYNASKAFMSNYLEGLRCKAKKSRVSIDITDVKPGLVDTAMAKGEGLFWVMPPEKAALQIFKAVEHKKKQVYITRRWRIVAFLLKILPDYIYYKF